MAKEQSQPNYSFYTLPIVYHCKRTKKHLDQIKNFVFYQQRMLQTWSVKFISKLFDEYYAYYSIMSNFYLYWIKHMLRPIYVNIIWVCLNCCNECFILTQANKTGSANSLSELVSDCIWSTYDPTHLILKIIF